MERKVLRGLDSEVTTGESLVLAVGPFSGTLNVNTTAGPSPDLSQKVDVPFGAVLVQIPLVGGRVRLMVLPLAMALQCRPATPQVDAALTFALRTDLQLQHQQALQKQAMQSPTLSPKPHPLPRQDEKAEESKDPEPVRYQFLVPSLRAEADDGSVILTWEPARAIPVSTAGNHTSPKPCVKYRLELVDPDFGGVTLATWEGVVGPSCFKGLTPDHSYMFRIQACGDEDGYYLSSVWSDFFPCRTLSLIIPVLRVTSRQITSLTVSWEKSSAAGSFTLLMYPEDITPPSELIEDEPLAAEFFMQAAREVYHGPLCSYHARSLQAGTPYFFRIRSHNLRSQSGWGPVVKVFSNATAPSPPAELITGLRTPTSIVLSWSEPNGNGASVEEYTLLMDDGSDSFQPRYCGKERSFVVTKLNPGTIYRFRVSAKNSEGTGPMSSIVTATTLSKPPDPPLAPVLESKQGRKATSLLVRWQSPNSQGSAVISYELQLALDSRNGKEPSFSAVCTGNFLRYDVTRLQPSTGYLMRVRAFSSEGPGEFSAISSFSTASSIPSVCGPPRIRVAAPFCEGLSLVWDPANPQGAPIIAYTLQMAETNETVRVFKQVYEGLECATVVPASIMSPEVLYCFRVQATNKNGAGGWVESLVSSVSVPPDCPVQPTLIATSPNTLLLTWQHSAGSKEARRYDVELALKETKLNPSRLPTQTECSVTIPELQSGCAYLCRLRTVNAGGKSPWTDWLEEWTHVGLPATPTNVALISATSSSLNVRWDHEYLPHPDISQAQIIFTVIIQSAAGVSSVDVLSDTQTTITCLLPGVRYKIRVLARNATGSSPASAWIQTSTLPIPPATPSSLFVIAISNNSVKLGWSEVFSSDNQPPVFSLDLRKAQDFAGDYARAWTGPGLSHKLRKLQPLTVYDIRLAASNTVGESIPTDPVRVTTAPDPPSAVTLASSNLSLRVSWVANGAIGVSYVLEAGLEGTWTVLYTGGASEFIFSQERARGLLGRGMAWTGFADTSQNLDFRVRCKFGEALSEPSSSTCLHPSLNSDSKQRVDSKAKRKTSVSSSPPSSCSSLSLSSSFSSFKHTSSSDSLLTSNRTRKRNRGHKPKKGMKQGEDEDEEQAEEEEPKPKDSCLSRLRSLRLLSGERTTIRTPAEVAREARQQRQKRKLAIVGFLLLIGVACSTYCYFLYG